MRLTLLVLLATPACGAPPPPPAPPASAVTADLPPPIWTPLPAGRRLLQSEQSAGSEPGVRVVRSRAEWEAVWSREIHLPPAAPPAPAVDFTRDEVVVVFAGQVSSGGHAVEVLGTARAAGGAHRLRIRRTRQAPDCMASAVMGAPVDVIRLPRSTGEPVPSWETHEAPCQ
ncbi:MAG: protease complex subunit PrcB family protein [Gemmatimonadales bacterium]|nr:protease complex subunit PrcB family protein [Gemmatimonadales bacterium]